MYICTVHYEGPLGPAVLTDIDVVMSVSFQARDKLMMEKAKLEAKLEASNDQIVTLKSHVGMIRKNTIAFILEQMDALHIQRDTEV